MITDITNSIKAKLYDFTYTPFMSSVVISWVVLNHKYLLIYFGEAPLPKKIIMLNDYSFSSSLTNAAIPYAMNIWFPIIIGLLYVFVYPLVSKIFYEYTLNRTKALKIIKQNIEDETPLTQEEAKDLRNKYRDIEVELNEAYTELETAKARYEDKNSRLAQSYIEKENGLEELKKEAINEATLPIQQKLDKAVAELQKAIDAKALIEAEKDKELEKVRAELAAALLKSTKKVDTENDSSLFGMITDIKVGDKSLIKSDKKLSNGLQDMVDKARTDEIEKINKLAANLSDDQKNILKIFNDNDTFMMINDIKNKALEGYKIKKPMIDLRLKELADKKILKVNSTSASLEADGLKIIELTFNQKH
ncbi:MAG: hypothetical protein RBT52_02455 [Sulfurimonas sp.]|jgi:hypothetical protein|nr:hypothetical protein [Sulfurimonas sp.]